MGEIKAIVKVRKSVEPVGETMLATKGKSPPFLSSESILKVSVEYSKLCSEWHQENLH